MSGAGHPERKGCFAERSSPEVEGPHDDGAELGASGGSHYVLFWREFPDWAVPGSGNAGSLDCEVVRCADDFFARDDGGF